MYFLNKPISSHLTIYNIQDSSLFSIFHRFSSIFLLILIFYYLTLFLCTTNIFFLKTFFLNKLGYLIKKMFVYNLFIMGVFHVFNGLRIILTNLNYSTVFDNSFYLKLISIIFISIVILNF